MFFNLCKIVNDIKVDRLAPDIMISVSDSLHIMIAQEVCCESNDVAWIKGKSVLTTLSILWLPHPSRYPPGFKSSRVMAFALF